MAEHFVTIKQKNKTRYSNDEPFHEDTEYHLLRLLEKYWNAENTQGIKPKFFLTDKETTHDLSLSPAIKVMQGDMDQNFLGVSASAKEKQLAMRIELLTLDRTLMFDCTDEIVRILEFCRRRPIPGWDFVNMVAVRRMDPRAGNYNMVIQARLKRFAEPVIGNTY